MDEELKITDYDGCDESGDGERDEDRVMDWEFGLPTGDDLTPLSQQLIPPELASAFSITPEPRRSMLDVNQACQTTLSRLRTGSSNGCTLSGHFSVKSFTEEKAVRESMVVVEEDGGGNTDLTRDGDWSDLKKVTGAEGVEEEDNCNEDGSTARAQKRPRLVWTPQLHKRFVDVVAHLGIKNAVPKTIMQLMNVEGLTRENVASHLQKYRHYLKRMKGLSNDGPSSSDHQLFSSTPAPQPQSGVINHTNGHAPIQIPMSYPPQMMPMPMLGMSHGHMGMQMNSSSNNGGVAPVPYQGYELGHPYSNVVQQGHYVSSKDR